MFVPSYFFFDIFFEPFHRSTCHGLKMGVPHCRLAWLQAAGYRASEVLRPGQSVKGTYTEVRNPGERDEVNQNKETGACFLVTAQGTKNFRWRRHVGTISVLFVQ